MVDWPHAPLHRFATNGFFFITAGTYLKRHYYRDRTSLDGFCDMLFGLADDHALSLQAWTMFSNHYHLVVDGCGEALHRMLSELHRRQSIVCNRRDNAEGRQVWYQFRDTELTFERSWLARLRYTHENAVRHGLVRVATDYPWCSAGWFERTAPRGFVDSVRRFKIDRVNVPDEFEVAPSEP
jgi:putative transposase